METFVIIALLVIIWIVLTNKINAVGAKIDSLKEELKLLSKKSTPISGETKAQPCAKESTISPPPIKIAEPPIFVIPKENINSQIEKPHFEPELIEKPNTKVKKRIINYERYIGENLFGKIGILVLVIGIGLFVKYAIDKEWINETLRTILGFVAGFGLLITSNMLRNKYHTFSSLLAGGAFAIFYITVAIAYHYYHLFSQPLAFAILVIITVLMSVLAILYNRRELAIISLVGGFIAPFMISSGESNYLVLFTYITILNLGMFVLSLYKKWGELPIISFALSWLIMLLYTVSRIIFVDIDVDITGISSGLLIFATLFFLIFLLPLLIIIKSDNKKINQLLLLVIVANNFIYLAFGLTFLEHMELMFKADGLLSLFVAVVNLSLLIWLKRESNEYRFITYAMLGMVLTFVSIAIPLQLDGNYITLFWASEMLLLCWLYIKSKIKLYEYSSVILGIFTLISFIMDIRTQTTETSSLNIMFLNGAFSVQIFTGVAYLIFAYLLKRYKSVFADAKILRYYPCNAILSTIAILLLYYTFMAEFYQYLQEDAWIKTSKLFTASTVLLLSIALKKRFPLSNFSKLYFFGITISAGSYLLDISESDSNWIACLSWVTATVVIVTFFNIGKMYYAVTSYKSTASKLFTIYINILATLIWMAIVNRLLLQLGYRDESNAGISISLTIAGLVQMSLGMRLHLKIMRIISLATFGLVFLKLIAIDLWSMPTVGKIIVFVILGIVLLILSFLYQKLKNVLFKSEEHVDVD